MTDSRANASARLRDEVRRAFEPLTSALTAALERVVVQRYPQEVATVEFEVFADPSSFTCGFPVRAFFMDADNNEHFVTVNGRAEYPVDFDPDLLDIPRAVTRETWASWGRSYPDLDWYSVAAEGVVLWFAACWRAARGERCQRPAFISLHDDVWQFDLKRGRWCDVASREPIDGDWPPRRR